MPQLDEQLLRRARTWGHSLVIERRVAAFSRLGEHGAIWLVIGAGGVLFDAEQRSAWVRATATVAGTFVANSTLKLLVRRPRPELAGLPPLTDTPTRLSFPSAHAATSFAGALAYSRLGAPAPALYAFAACLALSRLYLGVHYPSDLVGGAVLGTACAALFTEPSREELQR